MCRVDGVELLEEAIRQGKTGSESDDEDDEDIDEDGEEVIVGGGRGDVGAECCSGEEVDCSDAEEDDGADVAGDVVLEEDEEGSGEECSEHADGSEASDCEEGYEGDDGACEGYVEVSEGEGCDIREGSAPGEQKQGDGEGDEATIPQKGRCGALVASCHATPFFFSIRLDAGTANYNHTKSELICCCCTW